MWEVETRGGQRTLVVTLIKAPAGAWDFLLKKEVRLGVGRLCAYDTVQRLLVVLLAWPTATQPLNAAALR